MLDLQASIMVGLLLLLGLDKNNQSLTLLLANVGVFLSKLNNVCAVINPAKNIGLVLKSIFGYFRFWFIFFLVKISMLCYD